MPSMSGDMELWIKVAYTAFVAVVVPVYWRHYGWRNFLWFSDIALFGTCAALWLESPLLVSMMAVAVLLPELLWNVSFFSRLLFGVRATDLAGYMFDPRKPLFLRALSLFHVVLPPLMLWMLDRLGYDPCAPLLQSAVAWVVLPLTYAVLRPGDENVNWVRGFGKPQQWVKPRTYVALLMLGFPVCVYWPTHWVLKAVFR
ncbi:MAG: hypothetical protein ACM3SS_12995 [Rhodospirillaceae bacterium]